MGHWKDIATGRPYPENRVWGYALMDGAGYTGVGQLIPHPFYRPITSIDEWNELVAEPADRKWRVPIAAQSGTPLHPVVVDGADTIQRPGTVNKQCVWCGMDGTFKNSVCGHYICERDYRERVTHRNLAWNNFYSDVRLVRAGQCALCDDHSSRWCRVDDSGAVIERLSPVYGYLRTVVNRYASGNNALASKKITDENVWNQLCAHFNLPHWLTQDTRWDGELQIAAIYIRGVPTDRNNLRMPYHLTVSGNDNDNDNDNDNNNGGPRIIRDAVGHTVFNADDSSSIDDDDSEVDIYRNNRVGTRSGINRRDDDYSTDDSV